MDYNPIVTWFLGLSVGFWVDIGKEHFKRKIRLQEEHEADIRKEILNPIYQELKKFYCPICERKELPLEYQNCTIARVPKDITEDSYGGVEPGIIPRFKSLTPNYIVFAPGSI
jgi:hypothetical protein